jgi:hypothetical protein
MIRDTDFQTPTEPGMNYIPRCTQVVIPVKKCTKCNRALPESEFKVKKNGTKTVSNNMLYRITAKRVMKKTDYLKYVISAIKNFLKQPNIFRQD